MKNIIEALKVKYEYIRRDEDGNVEGITTALDDVSLDVKPGEFIAVLGHNGSGKSTLAKHINAILYPSEGTVYVDGRDTSDDENLWEIRRKAGMVFQNPDNQIIGQVVEEDVGFGPENLGVPTDEIWERVNESLKAVNMYELRDKSPNKLSGGQKQRVSIAGVLAMHPKCIILDEPTAMLDPVGRKEVIRAVRALNDVEKITIILITHYMEETVYADRIFVMDSGRIAMEGTPEQIFSRIDKLRELRLNVPEVTLLAHELKKAGVPLKDGILTRRELVDAITGVASKGSFNINKALLKDEPSSKEPQRQGSTAPLSSNSIILDHLSYTYEAGSALRQDALKDINLVINKGEFIGLIGHTGSGKSTLIQQLNGLLVPTGGSVYFDGADINDDGYDRKALRSKVGLVFQYPEHQLFEEDVFRDVCFGPANLGLSKKEVELRAYKALELTGLKHDYFYSSPFDLSGGEKRRAAIAGVLAMQPEVFILDEPTAGLDPKGRDEILGLIKGLHDETGMTVILVSHSMEDVANYVDRIIAMNKGSVFLDGTPRQVFEHADELEAIGLCAPEVTYTVRELNKRGFNCDPLVTTVAEARNEIIRALAEHC